MLDSGGPSEDAHAVAALECSDVWTSFGGHTVHRGLTLTMLGGQITGLIGPNGCGKSTLLNVITGAVRPDRGRILLNGRDLGVLPPWRRYRAGITRSFQNLELFEGLSVRDNLRVAMNSARRKDAGLEAVLARAGLTDMADRLPRELGYGQRKALSLARLYGRDAIAVLLDEPAAGLTPQEVGPILAIAQDLARAGAVVCIVEHNMQIMSEVAAVAHLLAEGAIIASGPPRDLMTNPELATIFFGKRR
jgi:branched-chain amino acid transport system ATP-binding protein